MRTSIIILAVTYLFEAILVIAQPWFSRKNVLFGVVFGNESAWIQDKAKRIRVRYVAESAAAFVIVTAAAAIYLLLSPRNGMNLIYAFLFVIFVDLLAETAVFILANRRTLRYKHQQTDDETLVKNKIVIETGITEKTVVLSPALALLLIPLPVATVLVAVFGYSHMPGTIPTHYNFTQADAWAPKSWSVVLHPIIMDIFIAAVLAVSFLLSRRAPASVRGNPGAAPGASHFRKYLNIILLLFGLVSELTFLITAIGDLMPLSQMALVIPMVIVLALTVIIFVVYYFMVREKKPSGTILDDDAKWVLGLFYYNPSDPSAFIEKRSGIGYSPNYAKPAGWIFTFGILAVVIIILIVSFTAKKQI